MKTKNRYLFLSLALLSIVSCKAIIEPSLAKRQIILQAPTDKYQTANYNVGFWWDGVEDALTYRLQVVTPDFVSPGRLVLDTLTKTNKFNLTIAPGDYQWRVRAVNGSSQSEFGEPRSFSVLPSSITKQTVQLIAPANTYITNSSVLLFQWGNLYGATKYHIQIDTNNFVNVKSLSYDQTIPGPQVNYTFPKDQSYQWRVRAENDTAVSMWSAVSLVIFDHTPPGKVLLTSPANGETVSRPFNLQWSPVNTATKYKLYVLKSDSTSAYNGSFPAVINTNSYNFTPGNAGDKIYWKVSAIDAAGNEGPLSLLRSFFLR